MKPTTKSCETDSMVVDQHLNTAYDVVKEVRDNLWWLKDLALGISDKLDHTKLRKNDAINQHPIESITGLEDALSGKQVKLISQVNIKSINGTSIIGSGNIDTRKAPVVLGETAPAWVSGPAFEGYLWFRPSDEKMFLYRDVGGVMTWVYQYSTIIPAPVFPTVTQNINMNGFRIFNLPAPASGTDPIRKQDFAGMLAKVGSGVTMVPTGSIAFSVGEAEGNNHYLCSTATGATVTLKRPANFLINQQATIIYFTQLGDGEIELVPDVGVTLVYPEGYTPSTFAKGATIAAESISNNKWLLVGNLGFE